MYGRNGGPMTIEHFESHTAGPVGGGVTGAAWSGGAELARFSET